MFSELLIRSEQAQVEIQPLHKVVIVMFCLAGAVVTGSAFCLPCGKNKQYHDTLRQTSQSGYVHLANESCNRI